MPLVRPSCTSYSGCTAPTGCQICTHNATWRKDALGNQFAETLWMREGGSHGWTTPKEVEVLFVTTNMTPFALRDTLHECRERPSSIVSCS